MASKNMKKLRLRFRDGKIFSEEMLKEQFPVNWPKLQKQLKRKK